MAPEFLFTVSFDSETTLEPMLLELAVGVLGSIGYRTDRTSEIVESLHRALTAGAVGGRRECLVRFQVAAGELQVAVCYAGANEWQLARDLP